MIENETKRNLFSLHLRKKIRNCFSDYTKSSIKIKPYEKHTQWANRVWIHRFCNRDIFNEINVLYWMCFVLNCSWLMATVRTFQQCENFAKIALVFLIHNGRELSHNTFDVKCRLKHSFFHGTLYKMNAHKFDTFFWLQNIYRIIFGSSVLIHIVWIN